MLILHIGYRLSLPEYKSHYILLFLKSKFFICFFLFSFIYWLQNKAGIGLLYEKILFVFLLLGKKAGEACVYRTRIHARAFYIWGGLPFGNNLNRYCSWDYLCFNILLRVKVYWRWDFGGKKACFYTIHNNTDCLLLYYTLIILESKNEKIILSLFFYVFYIYLSLYDSLYYYIYIYNIYKQCICQESILYHNPYIYSKKK